MTDTDANCRGQFKATGTLTDQIKPGPDIINKYAIGTYLYQPCISPIEFRSPFDVFAIAQDLGTVTSTTKPVVWAVGMLRDPAIAYTTSANETQLRDPYWKSVYNVPQDAVRLITSICWKH